MVSVWIPPFGCVILTRTVPTAMLSVTFVCMVTWASMSKVVPSGCTMFTVGVMASTPTKNAISVELMLLLESFAKKRTVYVPICDGIVKLVL